MAAGRVLRRQVTFAGDLHLRPSFFCGGRVLELVLSDPEIFETTDEDFYLSAYLIAGPVSCDFETSALVERVLIAEGD